MFLMKNLIQRRLEDVIKIFGIVSPKINIEYPENSSHGDYSSNIAMVYAKTLKISPLDLANKIVTSFKTRDIPEIKSVEVAGPGFINFKISDSFFAKEMVRVYKEGDKYGSSKNESGKEIMVEYTDPNPFKVFHIGHLMSNAIGESLSRLIENQGAKIIRANWQGDVGPHVAKAIWGAISLERSSKEDMNNVEFWGRAYVVGAEKYENDPEIKKEIDIINKKIYDRNDPEINRLYDLGRKVSLQAFEVLYDKLGTKFDNYFFEGKEGRNGEAVVKEFLKKGVFEESDKAIIFKGENHGLHTRVFITSNGLPTYETKELGLNKEKFKLYPHMDESVIITANEQNDYFKVLLKVFELIDKNIFDKTRHIGHGIMRFASGKMASRKGNVISGESLINDIKELVMAKIGDKDFAKEEKDAIADVVSIGAIKYTILRQAIGSDVIFDSVSSISFEGDSGPYLQYSLVRANSILNKAEKLGIKIPFFISRIKLTNTVGNLEKLLIRFPEITKRARDEYAPQHVANYLVNLAGAFNSFYASQIILDNNDKVASQYRLLLTKVFLTTMTNGLWLLGIKVPKGM